MRLRILPLVTLALASLAWLLVAQTVCAADDKWQAPAEEASKPNPEAKNSAAPSLGRRSYMHACVNCHEDDGRGQNGAAADLRSPGVQSQSDGALFWKITQGNTTNGMPSFTALPETERWDIVTFLRTFKQ